MKRALCMKRWFSHEVGVSREKRTSFVQRGIEELSVLTTAECFLFLMIFGGEVVIQTRSGLIAGRSLSKPPVPASAQIESVKQKSTIPDATGAILARCSP